MNAVDPVQNGQLLYAVTESVNVAEPDFGALLTDDEVEIEDMTWDETAQVYHYPCPCGDRFEITRVRPQALRSWSGRS